MSVKTTLQFTQNFSGKSFRFWKFGNYLHLFRKLLVIAEDLHYVQVECFLHILQGITVVRYSNSEQLQTCESGMQGDFCKIHKQRTFFSFLISKRKKNKET